jgi:hypothetical protein
MSASTRSAPGPHASARSWSPVDEGARRSVRPDRTPRPVERSRAAPQRREGRRRSIGCRIGHADGQGLHRDRDRVSPRAATNLPKTARNATVRRRATQKSSRAWRSSPCSSWSRFRSGRFEGPPPRCPGPRSLPSSRARGVARGEARRSCPRIQRPGQQTPDQTTALVDPAHHAARPRRLFDPPRRCRRSA